MMLSKPLVSLVIAFAARSSVAAFTTVGYGNHADAATGSAAAYTTPVRRGFNGGYPLPSNPTTVNQCNGGSTVCCNTLTTAQDAGSALGGLPGLLPNANPNVGLTCTSFLLGQDQCNTNTLCCQNVRQDSVIGIQCDPITFNL